MGGVLPLIGKRLLLGLVTLLVVSIIIFGAVELLSEAIRASLTATGTIDNATVRDHLFSTSTETVLGPFGVVPLSEADAGSQRLLVRLQLQWQDDGQGGLVQRVIYPDAAAEADPCVN